ncbi:hypothetical protein TWF225_003935 [Orbilia oligospora]|nr:hypothetical protein TWF225_003935 [Orbilia oligospora]
MGMRFLVSAKEEAHRTALVKLSNPDFRPVVDLLCCNCCLFRHSIIHEFMNVYDGLIAQQWNPLERNSGTLGDMERRLRCMQLPTQTCMNEVNPGRHFRFVSHFPIESALVSSTMVSLKSTQMQTKNLREKNHRSRRLTRL